MIEIDLEEGIWNRYRGDEIMYKWYLIYSYHDLFMSEFYTDRECLEYLEHLKEEYKNDNDFHWQIIKGISLERF